MDQVTLSRGDFRTQSPKLFVLPFLNGTILSMYPPRYYKEIDNHTSMESMENGYEQVVADVWVGVVLTLMVLSCVCCICSCLLYHRLLDWKSKVFGPAPGSVDHGTSSRRESGGASDVESLPSYTIVSGLPSYEEALEQLKHIHEIRESGSSTSKEAMAHEYPPSLLPPYEEANQPPPSIVELNVDSLPPAKSCEK